LRPSRMASAFAGVRVVGPAPGARDAHPSCRLSPVRYPGDAARGTGAGSPGDPVDVRGKCRRTPARSAGPSRVASAACRPPGRASKSSASPSTPRLSPLTQFGSGADFVMSLQSVVSHRCAGRVGGIGAARRRISLARSALSSSCWGPSCASGAVRASMGYLATGPLMRWGGSHS
jgi:hypothetical protein